MPVIISLIIAIFLISISWTWQNLGKTDKKKKIILILILFIILYFVTFIIFNISKNGIQYKNQEEKEKVRNVIVVLFSGVNALIIMPLIAKIIDETKESKRNGIKKLCIICVIVSIITMVVECNYMKQIQQEILRIYNNALQK